MAKTSKEPAAVQPNRLQRILAFMFAGVMAVSIIALVVILVAGLVGVDRRTGVWPIIAVLPLPGLSIAVLLLITLLVVTAVRRSQAAKDARG